MKNKKTLRRIGIVCLTLALLCAVCSAAAVTGRFYNIEPQYTAVSNTYGYSEGNFTGNYYSEGNSDNNAIVYGSCRGGAKSNYSTFLRIKLKDGYNYVNHDITLTSESENSNMLEYSITESSNNFYGTTATGSVQEHCHKIGTTQDKWDVIYVYHWIGPQAGWSEPYQPS